jgi:hypothetical protein
VILRSALLLLIASLSAWSSSIVVPASLSGADGNSSNVAIVGAVSRTFQYAYDPSELGLSSGDVLTGLAFRLNGGIASSPAALSFAQYDIQLSTSINGAGSLSTTFTDNEGADALTVRSGSLNFASGAFPAGATPNSFGPEISFSTPWTYVGGTLLITIRTSGDSEATAVSLDTVTNLAGHFQGQGSTVGSAATVANGATSTAAVIQLDVTPVPEPATALLLPSALALLMLSRRRAL